MRERNNGLCQKSGDRLQYLDGKPLILDINLFLKDAVPGLTLEIVEQSIDAYIEKDPGKQIVTSKRTITVEHTSVQYIQSSTNQSR